MRNLDEPGDYSLEQLDVIATEVETQLTRLLGTTTAYTVQSAPLLSTTADTHLAKKQLTDTYTECSLLSTT